MSILSKEYGKWKDFLLKSSLPLEQVVAEKLSSCGFHIAGEFAYLRNNEQNNFVEFSIDLRALSASKLRDDIEIWSALDLLIECKYSSIAVDWIFARYPKLEPLTSNCLHNYDFLSSFWVKNTAPIIEIEKDAQYVVNGLAITDKFADNKRVKHGLNQLRHAVPRFLEKIASEDLLSSDDNAVHLVAPILVTNSPLRVLKENVNFEDIRNANSLDDISDIHNVIYHYQQTGPELAGSIKEISEYICKNLDDGKRSVKFKSDYINSELNDSLETIAIVNLDYLDEYVRRLKEASASIEVATQKEIAVLFEELGNSTNE